MKRARREEGDHEEEQLPLVIPRDLADLPGPSQTGFLASPRAEGPSLADLALSKEQVDRFTRDGYVNGDHMACPNAQFSLKGAR